MRTLLTAAVIGLIGAFAIAPAGAETPISDRYEMKPVADGFLRLDRQTGRTDFCKPAADGYACRPTAEGQSADAAMIASLEKRVADLEAKVNALSGETGKPARDPTLDLPSDEQVDRVAGFLERAMKRLKKLGAEVQKDDGSL